MGSIVGWTVAAVLVIAGFILLLANPDVTLLAALALAIGIVLAGLLGISYGGNHSRDRAPTPGSADDDRKHEVR